MRNTFATIVHYLVAECPYCKEDIKEEVGGDAEESDYDDTGDEVLGKQMQCSKCKKIFEYFLEL